MEHDAPIRKLLTESLSKRDSAQDRLDRARREVEKYNIEVSAYQRALEAMEGGGEVPARHETPPPSTGTRGLSRKWHTVFETLYRAADPPYSYDDIKMVGDIIGEELSMGSLRTQMMNSVRAGLFTRVEQGKFEFTAKGLAAIGVTQDEGPDDAGPSGGNGDVAERSNASDSKSDEPSSSKNTMGSEGSNPSVSTPFHRDRERFLAGTSLSDAQPTAQQPLFGQSGG